MARYGRLLTDPQWEKIRPLLPKAPRHRHGGRPRAPDRQVLEGILWILRSGARWQDLPEEFPHPVRRQNSIQPKNQQAEQYGPGSLWGRRLAEVRI